jgi:hypothetical protein
MKKSPNGAPEALCDEKKLQEGPHKFQNELNDAENWFKSRIMRWEKDPKEDFLQWQEYYNELIAKHTFETFKCEKLIEEDVAMEGVLIEHLKSLVWAVAKQKPLGQMDPTTTGLFEYLDTGKYPKSVFCRLESLGVYARWGIVKNHKKPLNPGCTLVMEKIPNDEKTRKMILVWAEGRLRSLTMESMLRRVGLEIDRLRAIARCASLEDK